MNPNYIPDDRAYYNADNELDECCGDWHKCCCEECQARRDEAADMAYERKRDEEMGL